MNEAHRATARGAPQQPTPRRVVLSVLLALGLLGTLLLAGPQSATAAPVYEITGRWVDQPVTVGPGTPVTSDWRFNVNDDQPAPGNDPVENVTATFTVQNGYFAELPQPCLVDGVDPPSAISPDGTTLTCNLGTHAMGTAVAVQAPVVANGEAGAEMSLTGSIDGQDVALPPIPIVTPFGMDIRWQNSTADIVRGTNFVDVEFQWTIFLDKGSAPGPADVTYLLDLSNRAGAAMSARVCEPFTAGTASGHPWSGAGNPAEQRAPFVAQCDLEPTGTPGRFRLRLTGIDYSLLQVPTLDSAGRPLPRDKDAVATGQVRFRIHSADNNSVDLTANTPTYTAENGETAVDAPENNTSSKNFTEGGWISAWQPNATGHDTPSWWSDQFRVAPGAEVQTVINTHFGTDGASPDDEITLCTVLDTQYVTYVDDWTWHRWFNSGLGEVEEAVEEYYVGNAASVTPGSGSYDPNAFRCNQSPAGWTTTKPADLTTIKAVRVSYQVADVLGDQNNSFNVRAQVKPDTPIGQDIWQWGSIAVNGVWQHPNRSVDLADMPGGATRTEDARYPWAAGGRDIVRVIGAEPFIEKAASDAIVTPNVPFAYTLGYSANGEGAIAETVDGFRIVDTLPAGVTYVPGSATPEPTISTTSEGRQVLTWTLDDVATNEDHTLTYQAVADATVRPGARLVNSATATLGPVTTVPAEAAVTTATDGYTLIAKTADQAFIPNLDGSGQGAGSWTVTLRSFDPLPQAFTDTIDILPYNGDGRGTSFDGTYALDGVDVPAGATVYYTDAPVASLTDDPADPSNGAAGNPAGNTVGWTTTRPATVTAVRVIGGELAPGATFSFTVDIETDGAQGGDTYVNRAQARAEHTELVMRTSAPTQVANYYSASLKKYVQDADGVWWDANDAVEYPGFRIGDSARYRIVVENTGQGTLTNVVVSDDQEPELGAFTIDELAPGESETHEFTVELTAPMPETLINTACAEADIPPDSQVAPTINCDPAGLTVSGEPTHTKELLSATPVGDGEWELRYRLTVENTEAAPTSYTLTDELHFTDQATVVSAAVVSSPPGVTLADPAWDGVAELTIAEAVALPANDASDYAPHVYELTVVAEVPLQLEGAGSGADDPTACGDDGDATDRAFTNTSGLTSPDRDPEDDWACAPVPSIDITKAVSSGPTPNGDGTWTVTYDVVATNEGAADGTYEVTDRYTPSTGLVVESSAVVDGPDGVTLEPGWTGAGAEGAPENVIATGVTLPAGGTHTYQVEIVISLDDVDGAPVVTECSDDPGPDGLVNTATVEHNDLTDDAEACVTVASIVVEKTISAGPTPNGDGTWTIVYDIVAENIGAAAGDYDLADRLHHGEGIEILTAEVITTPDGIEALDTWTGRGAEGADENLVATDVTLAAGGEHTYQVEVRVELDEATIDEAALACPPPGGDGGLANSTSLTHNGIVATDDVCASLPLPRVAKTISAGPTANGDGSWTIVYDIVATNEGHAAGHYDVADRLRYGSGIEVVSAEVVTTPAGVDALATWTGRGADGADENVIARDVTIEPGATHTYQVEVVVELDRDVVTPADLACPTGPGDGALANAAELIHNGEEQDDEACAELPLIDIAKSISGAAVPVVDSPGQYDVTYEVVVTNRGPGAGSYDLDDELAPGEGIEVVEIRSVETDAADPVGLNGGFDGIDDTRIVTGQPIAGAAGGAPVEHTYTVTVRYAADLGDVEPGDATACTTPDGTVPGALHNVATVDWNGIDGDDDACIRPGQPTLDKELVSAEPVGDGQWRVVYDLTVGNVGGEPTGYDLDDTFLFAPVVTVAGVEVTGPDGVDVDEDFDGAENTRIATDITIAGLDDDGYAPHVYRVEVLVDVPLHVDPDSVEADGTGSTACTTPAGANFVRQGLNNAATLTDDVGDEQIDTDCAELPSIEITKTIASGASRNDDGSWSITYRLEVTNDGTAEGVYTLTDRLRYGAGITPRSATIAEHPVGVIVSGSWTGQGAEGAPENVVAEGVALGAGGVHTYLVTVVADVDRGAADATTFTCPAPGSGEPGAFANTAGVEHNDLGGTADACDVPDDSDQSGGGTDRVPSDPGSPGRGAGTGSLARTGGDIARTALVGLGLLVAGAWLVRRRRPAGA